MKILGIVGGVGIVLIWLGLLGATAIGLVGWS